MASPVKGSRLRGHDRDALAAELSKKYTAGESIRALAAETGRSYGFVHRLLTEAGAPLRGRGGATRRKATARPVTPTAITGKPHGSSAALVDRTVARPCVREAAGVDALAVDGVAVVHPRPVASQTDGWRRAPGGASWATRGRTGRVVAAFL